MLEGKNESTPIWLLLILRDRDPGLLSFASIVGATENATGLGVSTTGASNVTCAGVDILKAVIVGGVTVIVIAGAAGIVGAVTLGIVILGAASGVFTCGLITGASIISTVGSATFNETASFFTSFGEILASISTSLRGSWTFLNSTSPHLTSPFTDEPLLISKLILEKASPLAFFHEVWESLPGVIGIPIAPNASEEASAFFIFQLFLKYNPLYWYISCLSPCPSSETIWALEKKFIPNCHELHGDFTTWSPCSINWISSRFAPLIYFLFWAFAVFNKVFVLLNAFFIFPSDLSLLSFVFTVLDDHNIPVLAPKVPIASIRFLEYLNTL